MALEEEVVALRARNQELEKKLTDTRALIEKAEEQMRVSKENVEKAKGLAASATSKAAGAVEAAKSLRTAAAAPAMDASDDTERLFRYFDSSGTGELTYADFKLACQLAISNESEVKEIFDFIDKDGSGTMSLEEFRQGFGHLQKQIAGQRETEKRVRQTSVALEQAGEELEADLEAAREEIEMLENGMSAAGASAVKKAMAEKDSELAAAREEIAMLESGMQHLGRMSKDKGGDKGPQDQMEMLFNFYDVDGDGTLSLQEFKLACQMALDDETQIKEIFDYIDKDGDGEMDLQEFKEGFGYLKEKISQQRLVEKRVRATSIALEEAGEELEEELETAQAEIAALKKQVEELKKT